MIGKSRHESDAFKKSSVYSLTENVPQPWDESISRTSNFPYTLYRPMFSTHKNKRTKEKTRNKEGTKKKGKKFKYQIVNN